MADISIIANPRSGRGKSPKNAERLLRTLKGLGTEAELVVPGSVGESREVAQRAVEAGRKFLVVAGGDGTVRDLLGLLSGSETSLAILPSGRGNDLSRALRATKLVDRLARRLKSGQTHRMDLGEANGQLFATVATGGLDAEVGRLTSGGSSIGGSGGYVLQALKSISSFNGYEMALEADAREVFAGSVTLAACANTPTYGGGLRVAPGADISDGRLDLIVVERVPRPRAFALLPSLAFGQHLSTDGVRSFSAQDIRIETAGSVPLLVDGEPVDSNRLHVAIQPSALSVLA
ncbi:MAG: hypothetical protein CME19_06395 [Gemmatimonadetes bacterium]|nr:hypothetical protein [Gemmatimonadota bacterium]|tara:strand:+ start:60 stop:932 length:873 start_codon:yes stop_codon:yes gene_type:complete